MTTILTETVLPAFGLSNASMEIELFGSGLINKTWSVRSGEEHFILQRINNSVFTKPQNIAHNIKTIADYLKANHPRYNFIAPLLTLDGNRMVYNEEVGFFRLFPFVAGSHSKDVVKTPAQAYEAAMQFGKFTRLLAGLNVDTLKITIPFFHDLELRFQQFLTALNDGAKQRINESQDLIKKLKNHSSIVDDYKRIKTTPDFKLRVTHHDTKISNVLFDKWDKGICVIDLDTIMPGYFISDVGDMMRTYLSPVSEEETDFSKIEVREAFYNAIVQGYYKEMKDELTEAEASHFFYAGKFMIYMQALRFATDYLNNDVYYGAAYPQHNLNRAVNQLTLLEKLIAKEPELLKLH